MRLKRLMLGLAGIAAIGLGVVPGGPAAAGSAVDVDARLSQGVLKSGATQRVYLRIGIKGNRTDDIERTPVNVALVIDRSGSMRGDKIDKAREAALMAVDRLAGQDFGSLVVFDHEVDVLVPARRMRDGAIFRDTIAEVDARGRTAIHAAIQKAAREVEKNKGPGALSRIILMSDGLANVGPHRPSDFERLGQRLGAQGITVTTVGLGRGYNEDLMAGLASASDGNHAFARTASDLTRIFNEEFDEVLSVTAHDIEIIIETRAGIKPLRTIGRDGEITGNKVRLKVAQAYGTSTYSLQLELEVPAEMAFGEKELADVRISYVTPDAGQRTAQDVAVRARFSPSTEEVANSVDPEVMAPIIELQTRERTRKAVELRDAGRIEEARKAFEADALANRLSRETYNVSGKLRDKLIRLEEQSRQAAEQVDDADKWVSQRKMQRQLQGNAPVAAASSEAKVKY